MKRPEVVAELQVASQEWWPESGYGEIVRAPSS